MAYPKGKPRKLHGYTKQDLIDILNKCIPIYKRSKDISFHKTLEKHCTYTKTHWEHWLNVKKDADITAKFDILRGLQEDKTIEGAMKGDYNPAFSMFLLKCKYNYCEKQHTDRIALEEKKLALEERVMDNPSIEISVVPIKKREE